MVDNIPEKVKEKKAVACVRFSHMQQLSFFFSFKVFNGKSKKNLKFPKIGYNNVSRPFWRLFSCSLFSYAGGLGKLLQGKQISALGSVLYLVMQFVEVVGQNTDHGLCKRIQMPSPQEAAEQLSFFHICKGTFSLDRPVHPQQFSLFRRYPFLIFCPQFQEPF